MFDITKKTIKWGETELTLETGRIARQADGAVLATYGETSVLATAVAQKQARPDVDFFPLTVNYQEKWYAAGKIPGGFFKREGRPTEKDTLVSRLIDRPIRPLFPSGFYNETQVICTVLSHDGENDPDVLAMVAASAALSISGIPFNGPIGGARVGFIDGEYVLNPTVQQMENTELDLVVAGTKDSVMMVESEANCLTEEQMLGAVVFGHDSMQPVIELINAFTEASGKPRWEVETPDNSALEKEITKLAEKDLRAAYKLQEKQERSNRLEEIRAEVLEKLVKEDDEEGDAKTRLISSLVKKVEKNIVRGDIIKTGSRIDGRDTKTVRNIVAETECLPRVHGSALFTRGETQALVVATLGTTQDEQIIDSLEGDGREHFMLHYNFPPFSVGEASFLRGPGRREIGHGKLAWRALRAMIPSKEEFPYTLRLVSEITESNGSSSMATVCAGSLAMMDAGVPLKAPVAGIAMGLIKEGDEFAVLSDILGDEDHLGDMDFKVAGSNEGITALQMDIKIDGITKEIMEIALTQAKEGRLHILGKMGEARTEARDGVNDHAPVITSIKINPDKIREVIGSGGKVIREICEVSGAKVDIEDDGTIKIAAVKKAEGDKALEMINDIVSDPEVGTVYDGNVVRVVDFGAFVGIFGGRQEGLVHISELNNSRVEEVRDVVDEGDTVKVKCIGLDRGRIKLSMRNINQETGEEEAQEKSKSTESFDDDFEEDDTNDRNGNRDNDDNVGNDEDDRPRRRRSSSGNRDRDNRSRSGGRRGDRDRGDRRERGDRNDRGGDRGRGRGGNSRRRNDDDQGGNNNDRDRNRNRRSNDNNDDDNDNRPKKKKRFFGQF